MSYFRDPDRAAKPIPRRAIVANFMDRFAYTYLPKDLKREVDFLDVEGLRKHLTEDVEGENIGLLLYLIGVIGERQFKGAPLSEDHDDMLKLIHQILRKSLRHKE